MRRVWYLLNYLAYLFLCVLLNLSLQNTCQKENSSSPLDLLQSDVPLKLCEGRKQHSSTNECLLQMRAQMRSRVAARRRGAALGLRHIKTTFCGMALQSHEFQQSCCLLYDKERVAASLAAEQVCECHAKCPTKKLNPKTASPGGLSFPFDICCVWSQARVMGPFNRILTAQLTSFLLEIGQKATTRTMQHLSSVLLSSHSMRDDFPSHKSAAYPPFMETHEEDCILLQFLRVIRRQDCVFCVLKQDFQPVRWGGSKKVAGGQSMQIEILSKLDVWHSF